MFLQSRPSSGKICIYFLPAFVVAHGGGPGEVIAGQRLQNLLHIHLDVNVEGRVDVGVHVLLLALFVVLEGCFPLPQVAPFPLGGHSVPDAARLSVAANDLRLSHVCFSTHKWEAQLGGFLLAGAGMVAIIKDIILVDILMRVGEAIVREQVGQYCIFIRKVEGGERCHGRWLMLLRPRERQGPLGP
jgi:hypothetical protein